MEPQAREIVEKLQKMYGEDADIRYTQLCEGSWTIHASGVCSYMVPPSEFDREWDKHPETQKTFLLYGKQCTQPRYSTVYGAPVKYSTVKHEQFDIDEGSVVAKCQALSNQLCGNGNDYNAVLANWYLPHHSVAKHADDEGVNRLEMPILSVSFGDTRRFRFYSKNDGKLAKTMWLEHGDLVLMGGTTQQTHKHDIPPMGKKEEKKYGKRINFTVRSVVV